MATGVVSWSQTAATNATADTNVNWAEGMAPSQVNDSARAVMASVAKWRDDNAGTIVAGGGPVTYTATSNQVFSSLAAMGGQTLTVFFGTANGAAPTLNVDSLGAKPITLDDNSTALPLGFIAANSTHRLTYDNSGNQFFIHSVSPASFIPVAMIASFPNAYLPTGWLVCNGQAVSRATYANLFAVIGTTYGAGNGTTTFNLPNVTTFGIAPLIKT